MYLLLQRALICGVDIPSFERTGIITDQGKCTILTAQPEKASTLYTPKLGTPNASNLNFVPMPQKPTLCFVAMLGLSRSPCRTIPQPLRHWNHWNHRIIAELLLNPKERGKKKKMDRLQRAEATHPDSTKLVFPPASKQHHSQRVLSTYLSIYVCIYLAKGMRNTYPNYST